MLLIAELNMFKGNSTEYWGYREAIDYDNDFISGLEIYGSNSGEVTNGKMWSIIVNLKKDFRALPHWQELVAKWDIKLTPVKSGVNYKKHGSSVHGIRICGMSKDINKEIARKILDFIFQNSNSTTQPWSAVVPANKRGQ
jgi:hypothetical protein